MDNDLFREKIISEIQEKLIELKQKVLIVSYHMINQDLKESYLEFALNSLPAAAKHLEDLKIEQLMSFLTDINQITSEVDDLIIS